MTAKTLLKTLDYAILKPEASMLDIHHAAELCRQLDVGCLCVKSCDVKFASECLAESNTVVAAVVGFPHGNTLPSIKAIEAQMAISTASK